MQFCLVDNWGISFPAGLMHAVTVTRAPRCSEMLYMVPIKAQGITECSMEIWGLGSVCFIS